jgi:hypothetical protein
MRKIHLSGLQLKKQGVELVIREEFGIDSTGVGIDSGARRRYEQALRDAEAELEVDVLDVLLHGASLLDVVVFCYDHHFSLVLEATEQFAMDYLLVELQEKNKASEAAAKMLVAKLFPGGVFVRNKK